MEHHLEHHGEAGAAGGPPPFPPQGEGPGMPPYHERGEGLSGCCSLTLSLPHRTNEERLER